MKKSIIFYVAILFAMVSFTTVRAQTPFHIGLKAGANFTEMHSSIKDYNSKSALGYGLGAMVRLDLAAFYLQSELMFVEKNVKFQSNSHQDFNSEMKHIELPVVLGIKVIDTGVFKVRAFGGGVFNYMVKENFSTEVVGDAFKGFNKANMGYKVGAGIDLGKLTVDLSYDAGFKDISKNYDTKPSTFMVSAGFFIF
ncbi:MAG: PorT family protein [Flavobacteriaceae bacterium]|jgi:hypothetical protein|nr:PorT family protein [Flavobacteriaceae bacterium]